MSQMHVRQIMHEEPPSKPWMGRDTRQYPFMFPGREGYYERKVSRLHFKTLLGVGTGPLNPDSSV